MCWRSEKRSEFLDIKLKTGDKNSFHTIILVHVQRVKISVLGKEGRRDARVWQAAGMELAVPPQPTQRCAPHLRPQAPVVLSAVGQSWHSTRAGPQSQQDGVGSLRGAGTRAAGPNRLKGHLGKGLLLGKRLSPYATATH